MATNLIQQIRLMAGNSHIEDWRDLESGHWLLEDQSRRKHCYAERMSKRLQAMGQPTNANGFQVTMQRHMLELPLQWKRPRRIS